VTLEREYPMALEMVLWVVMSVAIAVWLAAIVLLVIEGDK
jgi:hypothetical protein